MLRYSVFVIVDGVFFQEEAVSPREVVEVLGDGALVLGASSMGALRAAECWPAGMRGVGAIYRLFRSGSLLSDDEVAVAVDPDPPHRALSVALVNVRFALRKAVRARLLSPQQAGLALDAATRLHYPERNWPCILRAAGLREEEPRCRPFLERLDLKRDDATRALRHVASLLMRQPELATRPRRQAAPFSLSEFSRERPHDPFGGEDPQLLQPQVCRYLLASGAYTRFALSPAEQLAGLQVMEPHAVQALWAKLLQHGQLDAAVFRWRALRDAERMAHSHGWSASASHRALAEREIARAHGFPDWDSLEVALRPHEALRSCVRAYRETLALAKRVKEALFQQGLSWSSLMGRVEPRSDGL